MTSTLCPCGLTRSTCTYHNGKSINPHKDIPVYDVTGVCFTPGVSTFECGNVYSALRMIGVISRHGISIKLNVTVYDRLDSEDQIFHCHKDGHMQWRQFDITIDEHSDVSHACVNSLITSPCGKQVILRTREY